MKKTIALVANSSWNIYNFRQPLIKQLKLAGYRVLVIAPVDEYIHYLNDSYFTRHIPLRFLAAQRRNPLWDLLLLWELYRIYRRERPDIALHFTIKPNIYGSLAARWAGVASIPTVTGLGYAFLHNGLLGQLARRLYQLAFRGVTCALFHNEDDRRLFVREGLIAEGRCRAVAGSGVNTNHFRPLALPDTDKFIFLFIGRLLHDKGIREFAAAARRLRRLAPRAECWVVGQLNPEYPAAVTHQELVQWIEEQDIRYLGATRDVRPYIKQAHALVLPSYREGLPRAILEAMAMGKPIVTTDAAGCRETVEPGRNGFLVPIRDDIALAETMLQLYHLSEEERQAMGDYSRSKALRQFDEKIVVEAYLGLCGEALARQEGEKAALPVEGY
ncbi:MAG: glycosyltransferase family 4 protein [Phaeodactylibacter sp.]|nr:glycosyltransferase family 4 protein [Phaeodactylibacter sp.]